MATPVPLSAYEQERARKIERNNALLRKLGLITDQDLERSNDTAWKRQPEINEAKKRKVYSEPRAGTRKSRRLGGSDAEFRGDETAAIDDDHDDEGESAETLQERRQRLLEKSRKVRQEVALRYSQLTDAEKKAAEENPTATYEHCLMRVRSMTDKGLANRIKAIERAAGKHCVIKMAIFQSCLQHEGMLDLAEASSEALERLKGLLPPVEN
jgi:hypothetical protein